MLSQKKKLILSLTQAELKFQKGYEGGVQYVVCEREVEFFLEGFLKKR
jgi:hypothetical protein